MNLSVTNLQVSMDCYKSLWFDNNPHFTDATAACMVWSEAIVDATNEKAAQNGGVADINPIQDLGVLYDRNLADLDGHVWEAFWMDSSAIA